MLDNLQPQYKLVMCRVGKIRTELEPADQVIFDNMITDTKKWTIPQISKQLATVGIVLARDTIRTHREGLCRCLKN